MNKMTDKQRELIECMRNYIDNSNYKKVLHKKI